MLVKLPHGACVDPEIVKLVLIRADRRQSGDMIFNVIMKTEADDAYLTLAGFDNRAEAEALAVTCADLINKGLGVEDDEDSGGGDDDDDDDDDDW